MADPALSPLTPFLDGRKRRARFSVRPRPLVTLPPVDGLLAGAAEVDITPPPGLPKAGYSANARDGDGFRTRLRARVLHLRSGTTSLAIVQCDLLGGSSVVHHLVAGSVADRTDVPLAGLLLGATHTHAGPGQFLGTDFYNRFASNRSGFDPALTQFLVDRITDAVVAAVESRQPARLATGSTEVWGLTRNRSLAPHVRNETVDDRRTEPQRKYVAVNPDLHLVRVDTTTGDPLATMTVFSVHGTGISMKAHEYNADLWAYVVERLTNRIEATNGRAGVVGAIEGTHADVAPALRPRLAGHREAARIGRAIGDRAADLHAALAPALSDQVELGASLWEVDLEGAPKAGATRLARRPAIGAALLAGAHENVTPVIHRIPPFRPGSPKRRGVDNPHGEKWVLGTRWLQPLVLPMRAFPRVLPLHLVRIGRLVLAGVPFEVTVESGRRMAAAARAPSGADQVAVTSVANEYCGYVATAEEYRLQHYEGGHTIYGPDTEAFLSAHLGELAADLPTDAMRADVLPERRWELRVRRYWPEAAEGVAPTRRWITDPTFTDTARDLDGFWEAGWEDAEPPALAWHEPLVRVERSDGAGWRHHVDDQGTAIEVTHLGRHDYRVRWHDPDFAAGVQHRFVLEANAARPELAGPPFD